MVAFFTSLFALEGRIDQLIPHLKYVRHVPCYASLGACLVAHLLLKRCAAAVYVASVVLSSVCVRISSSALPRYPVCSCC